MAETELGDVSYRGLHTAPGPDSEDSPIHEVDRVTYPSDVYSAKGKQFYGSGHKDDQLALDILKKVRGNPDADVVIYRAISPNADPAVHVGDWVTPSETYAREHGIGNVGHDGETGYILLKTTVKAGQLWTNGDSLQEWGYDPRTDEVGATDQQPDKAGVQTEEVKLSADDEDLVKLSDDQSVPRSAVMEAIDALESHPSFHVSYGLKKVPGNPIAGLPVKEWATEAHPEMAPKAATVRFLKEAAGVDDPTEREAYGPTILIGTADPKPTATVLTGGEYSVEHIEQAIQILEAFDGKLFKSELSRRGNPLGELSPNDLVGFNKDKTITKQKFIELLKAKIDA